MVLTAEDRQECEAITATLTAKYQFLVFNKVTSITDPLGQVTGFQYDTRGNLKATVDPLGNQTMITSRVSRSRRRTRWVVA